MRRTFTLAAAVTIEKRPAFTGLFDFDIHPTSLGHSFIAREFEAA